jgi:hypothetical protein
MTTTTITSRTDRMLDTLERFAPVAALVVYARHATSRAARGADDDETGASTIEIIVWTGIGLAIALTVGIAITAALRARAIDIGNKITNDTLPGG